MKKIDLVLCCFLFLTLPDITEGCGKLDLNQDYFIDASECNSSTLVLDSYEPDYLVEKLDTVESWVQIPLNLNVDLKSVVFIDELVGFAVGFKPDNWYSIILKTTDGGFNWTRSNINSRVTINSISSIDSTTLIAVGGGWNGVAFESIIYKTTNLGDTWLEIYLAEENAFNAVCFCPNGNGVIVGELEVIYVTTDKGESWAMKHIGTSWTEILVDVCFLDSTHILAVGVGGKVLLSSDLGNNWESLSSSTIKSLYSVESINGNLYAAGESGLILFSNDSGNSWQTQTKVTTAHLLGIHFTSSNTGYIVGGRNDVPGNKNAILKTTDAGITWQKQSHSSNLITNDVFFINDSVGWIVGNSGLILKTTNGGVTFIEEEINPKQPDQFLLQQNYPNPFNPSTHIQYAISSTQFVTLKVYDLLGREVATLVNEEKPAGSYNVEFRMQNLELSSGIYFYKLQAGEFVETKKMILLK